MIFGKDEKKKQKKNISSLMGIRVSKAETGMARQVFVPPWPPARNGGTAELPEACFGNFLLANQTALLTSANAEKRFKEGARFGAQ